MHSGLGIRCVVVAWALLGLWGCGSSTEHPSDVPVLVDVGPTWGPPTGGTRVTLRCVQADSVLTVFFNDQEATDVAFVRDQALNCTTPIGLPGWADVTVVGVGGSSTLAQSFLYLPDSTWVRADGGTQDDVAHDVSYLDDGTSIVVGSFEGSAVFGAGEVRETTLVSAGGRDAYLARYSANGALLRATRVGGTSDDEAFGVVALSDRSWLAVGAFAGQVVFGAGEANQTTLTSAGGQDAFLARYDADGRLAWALRFGGAFDDQLLDVIRGAPGDYAVVGSFRGTILLGEGEAAETQLVSAGLGDALVAVYDGLGQLQWAARGGGVDDDAFSAATAWPAGDVMAVGVFRETATFGSTTLVSEGARDGVLARYRADGRFDWAKGVHGPGDVFPRAAAVFDNTECAVTGTAEGEVLFAKGEFEEVLLESEGGEADLFLARYDDDGVLDWARRAGGTEEGDTVEGISIHPYADGTCLVVGAFRQRAIFGPGELGETVLVSAGASDLFFARYARGGALQWVFRDGGTGDERPSATYFMVDGRLLVTGAFSGTAALDPSGGGAIVIPSAGERDPFLGRYDIDE